MARARSKPLCIDPACAHQVLPHADPPKSTMLKGVAQSGITFCWTGTGHKPRARSTKKNPGGQAAGVWNSQPRSADQGRKSLCMRAVTEITFWSLTWKPGAKPLPGGAMAVICACGQDGLPGPQVPIVAVFRC